MPASASGTPLSDFVRALGLAWKNLAAYPPSHPVLTGSIEAVHRHLMELRFGAGDLAFGIAIDGLVFGTEKIATPQAQKFAHALYVRGVAVLRFDDATTPQELETFLRLLGVGDAKQEAQTVWEALAAAGVSHIHLQPVDYSAVQMTETLDAPAPKEEPRSLWEEIVRALLAGRELSADARTSPSSFRTIDELASLILRYVEGSGEHAAEAEFDPNATFGVRLKARLPDADTPEAVAGRVSNAIGLYVAGSRGLKRELVLQQVTQLLRTLPEQLRAKVIEAVLRVLATDDASGPQLREFARELRRDETLDALRSVARGARLSGHALLLLESLAVAAAPSIPTPQRAAVIAELEELFGEEDIDRFNPAEHVQLLQDVSIVVPPLPAGSEDRLHELGDRPATLTDDAVNRQVAATLLDIVERHADGRALSGVFARMSALVHSYLAAWQYDDAVELIERLQRIAGTTKSGALREAVGSWFDTLATGDTLRALVGSMTGAAPAQNAKIQRLIEAMGSAATRSLLIALAEEQNRSRRRRLFDFLTSLGPRIVPEIVPFLADSRWYVVRNMLVLLRSVNDRTAIGEIRKLAHHPDLRVRMEAIKALLVLESNVPRSLLERAINDPDPKLAETAITLVGSYGIREAVDPLLRILEQRDVFGARMPVRLKAIRALGELAEPAALPRLEHFFREPFLPWPAREERRAAYESLRSYPPDQRGRFVELGLKSRDPEIREICRKLSAR
jgi:hypothetical protein